MTGGFKVKLKFGTLVSTNKESSSCVDNVKPVQSDGIAIGLCKNTFAIHSAALKRGVGGTRTAGTGTDEAGKKRRKKDVPGFAAHKPVSAPLNQLSSEPLKWSSKKPKKLSLDNPHVGTQDQMPPLSEHRPPPKKKPKPLQDVGYLQTASSYTGDGQELDLDRPLHHTINRTLLGHTSCQQPLAFGRKSIAKVAGDTVAKEARASPAAQDHRRLKVDKVKVKLKEQGNVASGASGAYILSGGDIDAAETNHSSLSEAGSSAKRPHADTSERCSGFAAEFTPRLQLPEHPKRTNTLASLSHAYGKDASPENSRGILQQQGPPRKDLEKIIDKIQKKDAYDVFREPVTEEMAPGYFEIIKRPMDFLTIRTKVAAGDYSSWEELEDDLVLMFDNAMLYNSPETIFHKLALSMKDLSRKMIELGKQGVQSFRGRTAAIMRAHNLAQRNSVATAIDTSNQDEVLDNPDGFGEHGVAIEFGKSQGGRTRDRDMLPVRPNCEDLRCEYQQSLRRADFFAFGCLKDGASSEGVAFAGERFVVRPVVALSEDAYLRSICRFSSGLTGRAKSLIAARASLVLKKRSNGCF